jgi:hypothetical protein
MQGCARTIFGFWTGENPMPDVRRACWESFAATGLAPVLVTPATLGDWVVRDHPIHPAYAYLSPVHRADYLRPYILHHHGGGYSDIKHQTASWLPAVGGILRSRWLLRGGYREIRGGTPRIQHHLVNGRQYILTKPSPRFAAAAVTNAMRLTFPVRIGNCAFYFKPGSTYTRAWLAVVERRLDILLPKLRQNPARYPRDKAEDGNGYPVPWSWLLGDINGPLSMLFMPRLSRSLPAPSLVGYDIENPTPVQNDACSK